VLTYGSRWAQIGPKYAYRREGSSCAEGAFAQSSSMPLASWCCSARASQVSRAARDFEADSLVVMSTDGRAAGRTARSTGSFRLHRFRQLVDVPPEFQRVVLSESKITLAVQYRLPRDG
jgi:hypothetical protein